MATLIVLEDLVGPASIGRGGHAMYAIQWLHALERCGHEVWFVEFLTGEEPDADDAHAGPRRAEEFARIGMHGGWFSDRSACYLAAGRPVILQATGFADLLPTGKGLFSVTCAEEAAEAVRAIRRDYAVHSAAARAMAREYFAAEVVVPKFLALAGIGGRN